MAEARYRLRFLHISDIHCRGSREQEHWRRRRVLGDAWLRNLETLLEEEGRPDFVFFTGDAANFGLPDEYDEATGFLEALRAELSLPPDRLFVIPGNHDIARGIHEDVWRQMRMKRSASRDSQAISRWMNGISGAPLGFENDWAALVLERQSHYREWVRKQLWRPELAPDGLGYRATVHLPSWPFPIHVLGLDTAWLCGDDSDATNLLLTENQLMRHAVDDRGDALRGLRLALMHHPFHELADGAACRRLLGGKADLVLRGHLHEPEVLDWIDPNLHLRELAAGSLYEGGLADEYGNSCHWVRLEVDSAGRPVEAMIRFRSFSKRGGHWFDDNSLYNESKGGRLVWSFGQQTKLATPNPYSPWTPKPEQCFGREGIFRRLENALEQHRSVWLVGDWRIGKTLLLTAWEKRLRDSGRVVKMVSGQGAAGVSAASFVKQVTGLDALEDADGAADRLRAWIDAVGLPGLPPVILVDEVEAVVETCDVRFFDRLRGFSNDKALCMVFSSREDKDRVFSRVGKTSPLENVMETVWVGLLEPAGAEQLIALGEGALDPGDADLMRRWAGRHAFFLQLLGSRLVELPADRAVAEYQAEAATHLRRLWGFLSAAEKQELRDAARGVPAKGGVARGRVTEEGRPFAEVFAAWLREEIK